MRIVGFEYNWTYPGGTATGPNPSITFPSSGTYEVCFSVTLIEASGKKCTEEVCQKVTVDCGEIDPCICTIGGNFTYNQDDCEVCFTSSVVTNECTKLAGIEWSFGDGSNGFGENPCHTYSTPGTYSVTMTATGIGPDGKKCTCTHQQTIVVKPCCQCDINADFIYSVDDCKYCLIPSSSSSECTRITSYSWDFGNGQNSTDKEPCIELEDGNYNVCLVIYGQNSNGQPCSDTICKEMCVVGCEPEVDPCDCESLELTDLVIVNDCPGFYNTVVTENECMTITGKKYDFGPDNVIEVFGDAGVAYTYPNAGTY